MDIGRNLSIQVSKGTLWFSPGARIFAFSEVSHDVNDGFITKERVQWCLLLTLRNPNPRKEAHHIQREMQQRSTGFILNNSPISFKELIASKDLRWVVDDLVSLAQSDKLYIKSITESELKHVWILQQNTCWTRMITRQQKKDSANYFIRISSVKNCQLAYFNGSLLYEASKTLTSNKSLSQNRPSNKSCWLTYFNGCMSKTITTIL
jgi:hypothetical protein